MPPPAAGATPRSSRRPRGPRARVSVRPPPRHDLAVVLLSDRRAEGDQRDSVGTGLEIAHHAGPDAEDVPLPELLGLVVELDPPRPLRDHVDLLLLRVR